MIDEMPKWPLSTVRCNVLSIELVFITFFPVFSMSALPTTPIRQPLQKTCGNTTRRLPGSNPLADCSTNSYSPEQARSAAPKRKRDFHACNRRCCCSNGACQELGTGRDLDFIQVPGLKAGETVNSTGSRAYQIMFVLKDKQAEEVESFLSTKARRFIRKSHFNLKTDFNHGRDMSRVKRGARPTFELQLQPPSPPSSPTPTTPPQQQQEQQEEQQEEEEGNLPEQDDLAILPPPEPLVKRLAAFYAIQNPRKLLDPSYIIECVNHYQDKPDQLERVLVEQYGVGLTASTQQQPQPQPQPQLQHTSSQTLQQSTTTDSHPALSESVLAMRLSAFYVLHNPAKVLDPQWILDCAEDMHDQQDELEKT